MKDYEFGIWTAARLAEPLEKGIEIKLSKSRVGKPRSQINKILVIPNLLHQPPYS